MRFCIFPSRSSSPSASVSPTPLCDYCLSASLVSSSCSWHSIQTSVSDSTLSLLHKSVVLCPYPWWRHMWSKSLSSLPFLYAAGRYHCLFARWSRSVLFVSHCVFCCLWRRHLGALCCTSAEDWVQDTLIRLCGGQQPQRLALLALTTSEQSSSHVCRILFAVSGNQRFLLWCRKGR